MNMEVPGAKRKLDSRSRRVASNMDKEQISSHQPQISGRTPISTTDNSDTWKKEDTFHYSQEFKENIIHLPKTLLLYLDKQNFIHLSCVEITQYSNTCIYIFKIFKNISWIPSRYFHTLNMVQYVPKKEVNKF